MINPTARATIRLGVQLGRWHAYQRQDRQAGAAIEQLYKRLHGRGTRVHNWHQPALFNYSAGKAERRENPRATRKIYAPRSI
jgi:hypothetical protein